MSEHTPTPWTIGPDPEGEPGCLSIWYDKDGTGAEIAGRICEPGNAAFLLRAAMNHEALVAALEAAADYMGEMGHPENVLAQARAALANAKEG